MASLRVNYRTLHPGLVNWCNIQLFAHHNLMNDHYCIINWFGDLPTPTWDQGWKRSSLLDSEIRKGLNRSLAPNCNFLLACNGAATHFLSNFFFPISTEIYQLPYVSSPFYLKKWHQATIERVSLSYESSGLYNGWARLNPESVTIQYSDPFFPGAWTVVPGNTFWFNLDYIYYYINLCIIWALHTSCHLMTISLQHSRNISYKRALEEKNTISIRLSIEDGYIRKKSTEREGRLEK